MIDYGKKYNKAQLEKWYLEDGLSLTAIGKKLGGLSRQSVANRIRRCGIQKPRRVMVTCSCGCKEIFGMPLSRYNRAENHFKNQAHYAKYLRGR